MSETLKKNLAKYGGCALFTALLTGLYLSQFDLAALELQDWIRYLADGTSSSGILMIMVGALIWASNEGAMDGISYAVKYAVRSLIPGGRAEKDEKYGDYVARKRANKVKGYGFLFLSGGIVLALGLVLTALFYLI